MKKGNFEAVIKTKLAVLAQIISRYLESNKRLVVPQLGAFIVKTPGGSVVFSEFLKRDDGVLRGVLLSEGRSELEAAGEIDRFVFEIRHTLQGGQEFRIEGLGVMQAGANGTIAFDYDPTPTKAVEPASAPDSAQQPEVTQPSETAPKVAPEPELSFGATAEVPAQTAPLRDANRPKEPASEGLRAPLRLWEKGLPAVLRQRVGQMTEANPKASHRPKTGQPMVARPPRKSRSTASRQEMEDEPTPEWLTAPKVSRSAKLNPEPYVKGLRYGKPHRNTNVYTFVDGHRRIDRFLLVAIAAAVVAVGVIAYVFITSSGDEPTPTEQIQEPQTTAPEPSAPTADQAAAQTQSKK